MELSFCLNSVSFTLATEHAELAARLAFDFAAFPGGKGGIHLTGRLGPAHGPRPRWRGTYGSWVDEGHVRHVRYPGVWVHYDYAAQAGVVEGEDLDAVHERLYLTALSRVGEALDRRGLHRVHGLGVGDTLILLPPGGGKSTLAARLDLPLLSEDTPLLDRAGFLHPFPFRLGLRDPHPEGRRVGSKWLVQSERWAREPVRCRQVLVGARTSGTPCLSPVLALPYLVRDCVVGYGVPQVAELFLHEWPTLPGIVASRLAAVFRLCLQTRARRLWLGPDFEANARFVARVVRDTENCVS